MRGQNIVVIADDITGAAELAGMAHSHGLTCCLQIADGTDTGTADVLVVATDTRSMSEAEAVAETRRVVATLKTRLTGARPALLFKKTDSALRGHVVAELHALMQATGRRKALYVPANPSKGRVIHNGIYYINGTPIAQTDFSFDPEFPARTSSLQERFPASGDILMPDAASAADIDAALAQAGDDTILAGAADLFEGVIRDCPGHRTDASQQTPRHPTTLLLCGSTQSRPLALGLPVSPMPLNVYDGSGDISDWLQSATALYAEAGGLVLTIPHRHRTGRAAATHLREVMGLMTRQLATVRRPDELLIEGGATAFAALQQLGWQRLAVVREVAPGVVRLQADNGTFVTLKPGSYPWGPLFGPQQPA